MKDIYAAYYSVHFNDGDGICVCAKRYETEELARDEARRLLNENYRPVWITQSVLVDIFETDTDVAYFLARGR